MAAVELLMHVNEALLQFVHSNMSKPHYFLLSPDTPATQTICTMLASVMRLSIFWYPQIRNPTPSARLRLAQIRVRLPTSCSISVLLRLAVLANLCLDSGP